MSDIMAEIGMSDVDPHDEIERLEALIDKLDGRIAGCRKFVLAGQVAAAAGAIRSWHCSLA